jgi:acid phosphatase
MRIARLALLSLLPLPLLVACAGSGSPKPTTDVPPPLTEHVVIVLEENKNYEDVIGKPNMPFLNALAEDHALARNVYAPQHTSPGAGLFLLTGKVITRDRGYAGTVSSANLARELTAAGRTWRVYAEDIPSTGYLGEDVYPYLKRHNPFAYLSDVRDSPEGARHMVPFTEFAKDLKNDALPNFSFIVPNTVNDAHECPRGTKCSREDRLRTADQWLESQISPLLTDSAFSRSGLLIVLFDESENDTKNGGGHVPVVLAGTRIRRGFTSDAELGFESLLRLIVGELQLQNSPGASASAPNMKEFFVSEPR